MAGVSDVTVAAASRRELVRAGLRLAGLLLAAVLLVQPVAAQAQLQAQSWPRTVSHEAGELTLPAKPLRIVSTSPSVTGILLAIGAPVVASAATTPSPLTDRKGFFAQWAEVADTRGVKVLYGNLQFDIEAVIGARPDLVVASATGADSGMPYLAELKAQGIPTLVVNYSNNSWQDIALQLGKALGLEAEADAAVKRFDAHAAEVAARITPPRAPVSIVGYNIGSSYSVAQPTGTQARLLQALGFTVVGLPAGMATNVARASDYDFVSRENLSAAIQGESVFLLRGTDKDVAAFLADPVLANHPAVVNKRVYALGPTSFRIDYYSGLQMVDRVAAAFAKP
ncbi:iron-enterobactin transporter periplasmic-binding protein [Azorhizobium oxalatiphilum]|uniref:Iron-enterobactin transporter periplasmic-binding protein n=1 Tax=Azorhizobium oxalatiphilum TaxID=980631 RepID=A0A917BL11_9HYPH|nr:Fe2+-enterobactin ABC transporter substrate-binding protein [Azorhizobium oxalatiphilum]GGF50161.1 iron-enterobactin transporter periplasmic-binding protein [Azorhizobium oxalatiphilum]